MAWTNVNKPTGANWSRTNAQGKQIYDQSDITYNSSAVFYDSVNQTAWTEIAKPVHTAGRILEGMTAGLLIPLTYSTNHELGGSGWTLVNKPNN